MVHLVPETSSLGLVGNCVVWLTEKGRSSCYGRSREETGDRMPAVRGVRMGRQRCRRYDGRKFDLNNSANYDVYSHSAVAGKAGIYEPITSFLAVSGLLKLIQSL